MARISQGQALEYAQKVYTRFRQQGRSHAAAERDAERWVEGNFDVSVCLSPVVDPDPELGRIIGVNVTTTRCGNGTMVTHGNWTYRIWL